MPTPSPRALLAEQAHRPYPLPKRRWLMAQTWNRLLFAHWRVPVDVLRPLVPMSLPLDTFDGDAWVSVVPFTMSGVRARGLPPFPYLSAFDELNVRTYVTLDDKPGVWFFSLDAANAVAVEAARRTYHLPYVHAEMRARVVGDTVFYNSRRTDRRMAPGALRVSYRPTSAVFRSDPRSLDAWLTERYCLYATAGRKLWRVDIHHRKWPLQQAEATFEFNTVTAAHGFPLEGAPLLHYVERLDILAWWPVSLR